MDITEKQTVKNYDFYGEKLKKTYGKRTVVNGVSIGLNRGEVVGLLGPNGAGKTTTFYMMVGLVRPQVGLIQLYKDEVTGRPLQDRALMGIGYLPQEASVFRDLTVEENIQCVLQNRGLGRSQRKALLEELIEEFGLEKVQKSKGSSLSGGERRRVEIARALALNPNFVLLDEPFAGVDPIAVSDIQETIKQLKKKNIGVLITDHNVRETLGIVDRAYIMSNGELLVEGNSDEIINDPLAKKFYLGEDFKI